MKPFIPATYRSSSETMRDIWQQTRNLDRLARHQTRLTHAKRHQPTHKAAR